MSAVPFDLRIATPWRQALPILSLVVASILLAYRDTAAAMVAIWWRSETFNHALLVPPLVAWLIWRQRQRVAALEPRARSGFLAAMLAVGVVWLLSRLVVVDAASQFAFVTLLVLSVPTVLGVEIGKVLLFPLLFLYFAVPFGEFTVPTMMEWTANVTVAALRLSGVPVFREGQQFVIPTGHWSVIDECSGVRYLMASFMVGTLFAYLNFRSYRRRAVFMLLSLAMPVVANWVRAYLIVMMAYLSGNRLATGVDHLLYGWVFFGIIIFLMFFVGSKFSDAPEGPAGGRSQPRHGRPLKGLAPGGMGLLSVAAIALPIVLAPPLALQVMARADRGADKPTVALPAALTAGWTDRGTSASGWQPRFDNPSVALARTFAGAAGTVGVYVAYYRGQGPDRKLVGSQNVLVPMRDDDWNLLPAGRAESVRAGARTIDVRTDEILGRLVSGQDHRPHLVVWRFYWIDGRFVAGDVAAKLASAAARLRGRGDDGAAIVLHADADSAQAASNVLRAFLQANADALDALLRQARDAR